MAIRGNARIGDLPEQTGLSIDPAVKSIVALCPTCGETYSANRGDYFMSREDDYLRCCRRRCVLVRPMRRQYVPV